MKKAISIILILTIVLGLCACGDSGNGDNAGSVGLEAGFGRENITPDWPVGMAGYSDSETRKTKNVLDYIYLTCVAFREGETTILVYTADMTALSQENQKKLREHVAQHTGLPDENIFMGTTHTHSSCSPNVDDKWDTLLKKAFLDTANTAMADLAPIKMEVATDTLEGLNFVRHYLMNDGTYYGSNFGSEVSGFKAHALEYPDRQLTVLKLDREEKKDILMINWQAHPASAAREYDYTAVSADFVGPLRTKVETETNMHVAYYTGAAGNTNKDSKIASEVHGLDFKQYGQKIADHVLENLNNLKPVEGTGIKTSRLEFQAEVDHSWDHMIKEANEVFDLWKSVGKKEGDQLGATYDFTSVYQAGPSVPAMIFLPPSPASCVHSGSAPSALPLVLTKCTATMPFMLRRTLLSILPLSSPAVAATLATRPPMNTAAMRPIPACLQPAPAKRWPKSM